MDKNHRSLSSLVGGLKRRHSWAGQEIITRGIITKAPNQTISLLPKFGPETGIVPNVDAPFFCGIKPCKKTVAITDNHGDVTYNDLFSR